MAALHDEGVELGEELHPQPLEARPTGRRTKVLVAFGLGLAAAATYTLTPGGQTPEAPRSSLKGLQNKAEEVAAEVPEKRVVESNLGDFIDGGDLPETARPGRLGANLGDAASELFAHVAEKSSVSSELTSEELSAFKFRFISAMVGMQDSNEGPNVKYVERAKQHIEGTKPVMTKALSESINSRQKSFKVNMQAWMVEESMDSLNSRLIKVPYEVAPESKWKQSNGHTPQQGLQKEDVPAHFESGQNWPKCKDTIEAPHNQGRCGSCWVFGAAGALDSRLCIATGGDFSGKKDTLSRGFGASCAVNWDGCQGGWPHLVYDYMDQHAGAPSTDCVPYFGGSDYANHWSSSMPAPPCPTTCDSRYPRAMSEDMYKPLGIINYKLVDHPDAEGMEQMKQAIYKEGPIPYAFAANNEFMGYSGGVFDSGCGTQANHAVQALGWGEMDGKKYIQSLNSWGTHWGVEGGFNVAYCVVWHYAIPGTITNPAASNYPLPEV